MMKLTVLRELNALIDYGINVHRTTKQNSISLICL